MPRLKPNQALRADVEPRRFATPLDIRIHIDTVFECSPSVRRKSSKTGSMLLKTYALRFALLPGCDWPRPGNLGDWKPVGNEVSEMRVAFGPGFRLYFARRESILIVMLAGGDKSTQARDVKRAQRILKQLELKS